MLLIGKSNTLVVINILLAGQESLLRGGAQYDGLSEALIMSNFMQDEVVSEQLTRYNYHDIMKTKFLKSTYKVIIMRAAVFDDFISIVFIGI